MKTISKLQNSARKLVKLILTIQEDRVRQIYFNVIVDKIYIKNYRKFWFDRSFNLYGFVSPDRGMASDLFPFIFVVYSDTQFYHIIYNFLMFYIVIFQFLQMYRQTSISCLYWLVCFPVLAATQECIQRRKLHKIHIGYLRYSFIIYIYNRTIFELLLAKSFFAAKYIHFMEHRSCLSIS